MTNDLYHVPVLLREVLELLAIKPSGTYVDCTMGGGGHLRAVASMLSEGGTVLGIDRDRESIEYNKEHPVVTNGKVILAQSRFSEFDGVLREHGIRKVDGFLLDLGVSSHQIDERERGFSYMQDSLLDMRMDLHDKVTAQELIRSSSVEELAHILEYYGEIGNPSRMAHAIKRWQESNALSTSQDLKRCIESEYGPNVKYKVLSKLFQALRIAVNRELEELESFLHKSLKYICVGGRLAVISYHSLEDRIVKEFMRSREGHCVCPSSLPSCICSSPALLKRITRKAVKAGKEEIESNPRSRSARLRVALRTSQEV